MLNLGRNIQLLLTVTLFKIKRDQNGLKGKLYTGGKGMAPHAQLSTRFVLGLF